MEAELKAKWVAALRSGNYKQGKNTLKAADKSFCCIGVLCDIIDPNGWDDDVNHESAVPHFSWRSGSSYLTDGLDTKMAMELGLYLEDDIFIGMNDDDNKTFSEIADYIENEWDNKGDEDE